MDNQLQSMVYPGLSAAVSLSMTLIYKLTNTGYSNLRRLTQSSMDQRKNMASIQDTEDKSMHSVNIITRDLSQNVLDPEMF